MNTATQPLITPPNKPNHSVRTIWILLILGTFCSFGIAILSTPFLLLGLFLGILGTITLLFGAFQHTGFANSFDEFIGNRQKKPNRTERPSQVGKYLRRVLAVMLLSDLHSKIHPTTHLKLRSSGISKIPIAATWRMI